jgi:beta-lactamase regulating signal transducer with metallopeptidase domain
MITVQLFTSPVAQSIGWSLLHLVWQAAIVAVVLACALQLMRKASANSRYAVSCMALAAMLLLPAATAIRVHRSLESHAVVASEQSIREQRAAQVTNEVSLPLFVDAPSETPTASTAGWSVSAVHLLDRSLPFVLALWTAGVLLFSLRLFGGWLRVQRLARSAAVAAGLESDERLRRLTGRMKLGRAVRLVRSALVEVPTVIGAIRPVILLPLAALTGMNNEQIEMILAHELAHIRRNDYFVNIIQSVIETLFFYHPAVWWVSRQVRIERENCCDDLAVSYCGDPVRYALALTELEHIRSSSLAVAANGGSLLSRIRRLAGCSVNNRNCAPTWVTGMATLSALAVVLVLLPTPLLARRATGADPQSASAPRPATPATPATPPAPPSTPAPRAAASSSTMDVSATPAVAPVPEADDSDDTSDAVLAQGWGEFATVPPVPPMPPMPVMPPMVFPEVHIAPIAMPAIHLNPVGLTPEIRAAIAESVGQSMDNIDLGPAEPDTPEADAVERAPRPPRPPRVRIARAGRAFGWSDEKAVEIKPGPGPLSVDELITLRMSGVDPQYVKEMNSLGLGELSLNDLLRMRQHGVTPEYIRSLGSLGIQEKSAAALMNLRDHGLSAEYIKEMRQLGFANASPSELIELHDQGVSPAWVKGMADAGYKLSTGELKTLRLHGVSSSYVQSLSQAGYRNLSPADLVRLHDHGVSADFLAAAKESGYGNLSLDDIIRLRSNGVSAHFLREMAKMKK